MTKRIQIEALHYRPDSLAPDPPDILNGISLEIEPGSLVAIIGQNGSGKTTLIQHINGLLLPTAGRVIVGGLDTRDAHSRRELRSLVGMVFQNPADQIVASTVAEDVAFGLENANLPTAEIQLRVAQQLSAVGLLEEADRPPHLLSGGQIQKVALAGVLVREPGVLLFDEPTTMLDPVARVDFLAQIQHLHRQGLTILYVTHHMEEAVGADRVLGLAAGQVVLDGSPQEIFSQSAKLHEIRLGLPETAAIAEALRELGWRLPKNLLVPEDLIAAFPAFPGMIPPIPITSNQHIIPSTLDIIRLTKVHYTYLAGTPLAKPALLGVDLAVPTQTIHAIAGANGSGKSTLLQHCNGILRPAQGSVRVGSFALEDPATSLRSVVREVGLVFQSPETQFFEVFVGDEIAYGPKQFEMSDVRERVQGAMALVGLDFAAYKDRRLINLSGGEKRKVALASTLVLDQGILLFDEPTAGMDPGARVELLSLFQNLKAQGKTLLIASHRLDELAQVASTFSIMQSGQVTSAGARQAVLFDPKALPQAGLTPPLAVMLSRALIAKGWPIAALDTSIPARLLAALREVSA